MAGGAAVPSYIELIRRQRERATVASTSPHPAAAATSPHPAVAITSPHPATLASPPQQHTSSSAPKPVSSPAAAAASTPAGPPASAVPPIQATLTPPASSGLPQRASATNIDSIFDGIAPATTAHPPQPPRPSTSTQHVADFFEPIGATASPSCSATSNPAMAHRPQVGPHVAAAPFDPFAPVGSNVPVWSETGQPASSLPMTHGTQGGVSRGQSPAANGFIDFGARPQVASSGRTMTPAAASSAGAAAPSADEAFLESQFAGLSASRRGSMARQ